MHGGEMVDWPRSQLRLLGMMSSQSRALGIVKMSKRFREAVRSLHWLRVGKCPKWTNLEQINECRDLKDLELKLDPQQWDLDCQDEIGNYKAFVLAELLRRLRSVMVDVLSPDVVYKR
ncbi:hypothetical protein KC19_9G038300 [Ceratodon purpureus]|uniref:Uncharacterized protein n=1 Tax=Ceratodon purpureus TaxID=3225 RepID=A0A8T0GQB7_CERPU|nr:hypothetical protein KC19_9G038300 [Ceratodon purpureus]